MLESMGYATAYVAVGLALLMLGFFVLDALTPGKLLQRVWEDGSVNASIITTGAFVSQAIIVFTTIWVHARAGFGEALEYTIAFGVLGVVLEVVAFLILDLLTPGKLGELASRVPFHPASVITAGSQLAVAMIIAASIA